MTRVLLTDFDGTVTRRDFYEVALERLVPPALRAAWTGYETGQLTHFEALRTILAAIRDDEATVVRALGGMDLDPQFGQAVQRLRAAGWQIVVVSAGCRWYIDRLIGDVARDLTVHANPGELIAGRGLQMALPQDSPFLDPSTGVDKVAIVRDALARHEQVVFAGNGPPDLAPALLVPPARRFARGWLAQTLAARGERFVSFDRWSEIADLLVGPGSAA